MLNCRGCGGETTKGSHYKENLSKETLNKTLKHPCYNKDAHDYSRIHLPVAPACNIKCKFCNRKFDCSNESRPGVTSNVLTPVEAYNSFEHHFNELGNLTVMGIAGPGDPLANFEKTKMTINLIKEKYPEVAICLSTNGLMLPKYARELKELGVTHLTVTINAVDPYIGEKIYDFVEYEGKIVKGYEGAKLLMTNQLEGLSILKDLDIMCKVNIVAIKEVNDVHIREIVKEVKERGVTFTNIMSLIPVAGTPFEHHDKLTPDELHRIRKACESMVTQMYHCRQCRADAVGQLKGQCKETVKKIS